MAYPVEHRLTARKPVGWYTSRCMPCWRPAPPDRGWSFRRLTMASERACPQEANAAVVTRSPRACAAGNFRGHMYQSVPDSYPTTPLLIHILHEVRAWGFRVAVLAGAYPSDHAPRGGSRLSSGAAACRGATIAGHHCYELLRAEGQFAPGRPPGWRLAPLHLDLRMQTSRPAATESVAPVAPPTDCVKMRRRVGRWPRRRSSPSAPRGVEVPGASEESGHGPPCERTSHSSGVAHPW